MKIRNILITSANSYGNVGDDICGYSAKYIAEQAVDSANVTVTSPPMKPELVDAADVIVVGGGGVIYDTDYANVENYMSYVERAQSQNKTTAVLGVGVQGIGTDEGKKRYRETLSRTDVVSVRSPVDQRLMNEVGVHNAVANQDLGFLTDEWVTKASWIDKIRVKRVLRQNEKPNLGLAIVDLVSIKGDAFDDKSANFVDSLNGNLDKICSDFNVYLLVHSADDDRYYKELESRYDLQVVRYKNIKDLPYFWEVYKNLDLVIGSRFHSIILACLAQVPVVGISSESTKQNRLANYDMPTLLSQRLLFSQKEQISSLFSDLKHKFDSGEFKIASAEEVQRAKNRAYENVRLLKDAIETSN